MSPSADKTSLTLYESDKFTVIAADQSTIRLEVVRTGGTTLCVEVSRNELARPYQNAPDLAEIFVPGTKLCRGNGYLYISKIAA